MREKHRAFSYTMCLNDKKLFVIFTLRYYTGIKDGFNRVERRLQRVLNIKLDGVVSKGLRKEAVAICRK